MATQDISQLVVEVKSTGIQTASKQLDSLAKSAESAEKAVKKLGTAVVTAPSANSGTAAAINNINKATQGTTEALRQKAVAQKRDVELHALQGQAYARAHAEALKVNAALDRKAASAAKAAAAVRVNNDAMREAHALARGLSGSLGALWVTYGNLVGMGVGIAIGASLKGVVTVGAEVEHTLEKVRVLGQATTGEIELMGKMVTELGQGAHGPRDVAEAFSVLTLAGLNAKEAMRGVGAALNLAITGDVSVEKASETLVQVATALGYTSKSFDHIGDVIAKTAAVSMSSVQSISASFMSAAAAGEVYGARLQDMGLGLAALANLGVKATAAGTALKNFYKDLSSGTGKSTEALKLMGLTVDDLKGADGKFIPIYDMIMKIDKGMSKLQPKVRSLVLDMAQGERGIKQSASLIGLIYQEGTDKAGKAISKLQEMRDAIADSAAFSTMAALAMAQTTSNQMKAVGNTLQTSFVDVFKSVSPEISVISRNLKSTFASDEFKNSLRTLVVSLATLTKALVDNGRTILTLIGTYAALKIGVGAIGGAISLLRGGIVGVTAVKAAWAATSGGALVTGLGRAGIAVRLFQASLGPLGLAIAALTTLWSIYESRKAKAIGKPLAQENLEGFVGEVEDHVKKEQKELDIRKRALKEGKTYEQMLREQDVVDQRETYDLQLKNSQKATNDLKATMEARVRVLRGSNKASFDNLKDSNVDPRTVVAGVGVKEALEAHKAYKLAEKTHTDLTKRLAENHAKLKAIATEKNAMDDAEAQRLKAATGNVGLPEKVDKAAVSQKYFEDIQRQEQIIANARSTLEMEREAATLKHRAGLITELDMVHAVGEAEKTFHGIRVAAIQEEARIAKDAGKGPDRVKFEGEAIRALAEQGAEATTTALRRQEVEREAHEAAVKAKIKSEELLGNFRAAAELRWGADNKRAYADALKNAEKYGGDHVALVAQFEERKREAMAEGSLKEEIKDFDIAIQRTQNTLKGFQANTVGKSWIEVWKSATAATKRYNEELQGAQTEYEDLRKLAAKPGATDAAIKAAEAAQGRLLKVSDNFRQMWVGTGEAIAKSMERAFGPMGAKLGEMIKISAEYQAQKDKSFESDMAHYGDLAGAASGFFDEQSKGYKVLNTVAQMFHVASMARTLAQTAASVAAGAAQFFAQSGWAGFAGVAAMGAVMAGLGYMVSGAGNKSNGGKSAEEMQKIQGSAAKYGKDGKLNYSDMTGGVFGDAEKVSESIKNSLDLLKSNSNIMLPVNQAMLASLRGIEASMSGLTNLVVRTGGITDGSNMGIQTGKLGGNGMNFWQNTLMGTNAVGGGVSGAAIGMVLGGPIGAAIGALLGGVVGKALGKLWGGTTQDIKDSGLSFGGKVSDLQKGQGFNQYASVDTTKKSWFGLKKDTSNNVQTQGLNGELSAQFGLVFSNLEASLKLAGTAFGKTANEVGNAIDNLVLQTTTVSLKDLKGEALQEAINGVISKAMDEIAQAALPGLDDFRKVGEGYAQTAIRVASGIEQANLAMEQLNISSIQYTQVANKQGDVAAEIAKQSLLAHEGMTGIADMLKNMGGSMEDLVAAYKALDAIRKQMNLVHLNGNGLNVNVIKGAGGVSQLQTALSSYQDKYFTEQEKSAIMLKSVTAEFNKLGVALPANKAALRKLIEETGVSTAENAKLTGQLLGLSDAYAKAVESAEQARRDQADGIKSLLDSLRDFAKSVRDFRDSLLLGDLSTLTPEQKYTEAKSQYDSTLSKAMGGDADARERITGVAQALLEASRVINASDDAYGATFSKVLRDMESLEASADAQISDAQRQLDAINAQVEGINALNVTAGNILTALVSPPPVSAPAANDNSDVVAELKALREELAATQAANEKKISDLIAATYDSQDRAADKIVEGSVASAREAAWANKNMEINER